MEMYAGHGPAYEEGCPVCTHPAREVIEELYVAWKTLTWLEARFDLPPASCQRHMRATGLTGKRHKNREAYYEAWMERGEDVLDELPAETVAKMAHESAKHLDKLQGKIVSKHEVEAKRTISLVAAPLPGGIIEGEAEEMPQIAQKEPERLLPPGGEVIENQHIQHEEGD